MLELQPWDGRPQHEDNPGAAVRYWNFGPERAGQVVYLILEDQREVRLLLVRWPCTAGRDHVELRTVVVPPGGRAR
ncbi:hypothetical protein [Saccharothrix luteola]|uniref:hypothetical protein n=1 Tax=Saccharothrix luteola TaxID=2893018 RepID=UPI001E60D346|nr:hypothetical protein [Saccharothrix luteola]MCC8242702.1 hypothetical protein [Saccharothrix luteola]